MINDHLMFLISFIAGMLLGTFYFGGLWLTLKQLPNTKKPIVLTLGSFFGRTGISLFGFYLIVNGGYWERLLICLIGFMLIKIVLVRRLGPGEQNG